MIELPQLLAVFVKSPSSVGASDLCISRAAGLLVLGGDLMEEYLFSRPAWCGGSTVPRGEKMLKSVCIMGLGKTGQGWYSFRRVSIKEF